LALRPFVPAQAQLDAPRSVAADLHKRWAELLVVNVEVNNLQSDEPFLKYNNWEPGANNPGIGGR
jgi:hypothetical protein